MDKKLLGSIFTSTAIHMALFVSIGTFCNLYHKVNYSEKAGESSLKGVLRVSTRTEYLKPKRIEQSEKLSPQKKKQVAKTPQLPTKSTRGKVNQGENQLIAAYLSEVRSLIVKNKYKNRIAKRLQLKGKVGLSFKISWPNEISDIAIILPSEHEPLNHSAKKSIESLSNIPAIPNKLKQKSIPVSLNMIYE